MELMFSYFWLIKLLLAVTVLYVVYIAFWKKKFTSKLWNTLAAILLILSYIQPIKMVPTTSQVVRQQSNQISQSKSLPPMVSDTSFKDSTPKGITKKDLK